MIYGNFPISKAFEILRHHYVDGILADFGVSSYQFEKGSRGFSTRLKGPLDMRMNTESRLTAREVINEYSAEELYQIFKNYGELRNAKNWLIILSKKDQKPHRNHTWIGQLIDSKVAQAYF